MRSCRDYYVVPGFGRATQCCPALNLLLPGVSASLQFFSYKVKTGEARLELIGETHVISLLAGCFVREAPENSSSTNACPPLTTLDRIAGLFNRSITARYRASFSN